MSFQFSNQSSSFQCSHTIMTSIQNETWWSPRRNCSPHSTLQGLQSLYQKASKSNNHEKLLRKSHCLQNRTTLFATRRQAYSCRATKVRIDTIKSFHLWVRKSTTVRVFMEQHQASKPHSHHPSFITRLDMDPVKMTPQKTTKPLPDTRSLNRQQTRPRLEAYMNSTSTKKIPVHLL